MPKWRERIEKAKQLAREKAPEVRARTGEAADRARTIAQQGTAEGRARIDATLAQRRHTQEQSERWFAHTSGNTHTQGFASEESMRRSIAAAAEHGWTVLSISNVPQRRVPGGLSVQLARAAIDRVRQTSQFMVTFRRAGHLEAPPQDPADPAAGDP